MLGLSSSSCGRHLDSEVNNVGDVDIFMRVSPLVDNVEEPLELRLWELKLHILVTVFYCFHGRAFVFQASPGRGKSYNHAMEARTAELHLVEQVLELFINSHGLQHIWKYEAVQICPHPSLFAG